MKQTRCVMKLLAKKVCHWHFIINYFLCLAGFVSRCILRIPVIEIPHILASWEKGRVPIIAVSQLIFRDPYLFQHTFE